MPKAALDHWSAGAYSLGSSSYSARRIVVNVKQEARELIERLPEDATWEDLMREIYIRRTIASGIADSEEGRTTPLQQVRERFRLDT